MANHFRSSERQDETADMPPQEEQPSSTSDEAQASSVPDSLVDQIMAEESVADDPTPAQTEPVVSEAPVEQTMTSQPARTSSIPDPMAPAAPTPDADPFAGAQAVVPTTASVPADPTAQPGYTSVFAPLSDDSQPVARDGRPTISLRDVTMIYPAQPNKPALQDVAVDIYAGEFVFLVGHSGSGKSTFLKLLTREVKATKGEVIVAGKDLTKMRNSKVPFLRRQIGSVFQDFKLLQDKTIYENVAFALECIGKPRSVIKAQVPEALRLVGLGDKLDVFPDQLSGGEQQRVSVARAMVNRPPLLVCDEPTGNLDPAISLGIMKLLERINRTGTTVIMATHDREMVDSMRKRVIALEAGHVVRDQEKGGYGYYGAL